MEFFWKLNLPNYLKRKAAYMYFPVTCIVATLLAFKLIANSSKDSSTTTALKIIKP